MPDAAQLGQRADRRLPAVGAADAPPWRVVEVDAWILPQVLDVVERVLDQTGHRSVVAGRADHDGIGVAERGDQFQRARRALQLVGGVHRQIEVLGAEQPGVAALALHRFQAEAQRPLGRRVRPQRSTKADDEGFPRTGHVDTHLIAIGLTGAPTAPTTFSGGAMSWNS